MLVTVFLGITIMMAGMILNITSKSRFLGITMIMKEMMLSITNNSRFLGFTMMTGMTLSNKSKLLHFKQ